MRKSLIKSLRALAVAALIVPAAAMAEAWPSKPIRIVVPFAPGGSMDIMARSIGAGLAESLKAKVYVENKPGAGGAIGALDVARSPGDGYHLLIGNLGTHVTNPLMMKKIGYDPVKDFEPIRYVQQQPLFLAVAANFPAKSVKELVEQVKSRKRPLAVGAPGHAHRIGMAQFAEGTGIEISAIPYGGPAPALTDLMGGHIEAVFDTGMALVPLYQQGKVRLLGVGSQVRSPSLPEIPTIAEQGIPGFEMIGINAIYAPAGTPKEIIERLSAEIGRIVATDDVQKRIIESGGISVNQGPQELAAWQRQATDVQRGIITRHNFVLD